MKKVTQMLASTLAAAAFAAPAIAANQTFNAQWKSLDQVVVVNATFTVDLNNPAFQAGPDWWYLASSLTNFSLTVSGSALPAANGSFPQGHFDWMIMGPAILPPANALLDPNFSLAFGANGSGGLLGPSAAGGGGTMQVGSGGAGGVETVYFRSMTPVAAVPEPAAAAMALAGLGVLGLAVRRQRRQQPLAA